VVIHLADIKTPDSTGHLCVLLLLFFQFSFFLWTTLRLFLFFPFAFIFTSFVTHVCFSVFKIDLRRSWWVSFVLISGQSRTPMIEYNSGVWEGQEKTPAITGVNICGGGWTRLDLLAFVHSELQLVHRPCQMIRRKIGVDHCCLNVTVIAAERIERLNSRASKSCTSATSKGCLSQEKPVVSD